MHKSPTTPLTMQSAQVKSPCVQAVAFKVCLCRRNGPLWGGVRGGCIGAFEMAMLQDDEARGVLCVMCGLPFSTGCSRHGGGRFPWALKGTLIKCQSQRALLWRLWGFCSTVRCIARVRCCWCECVLFCGLCLLCDLQCVGSELECSLMQCNR